MKTYFIDYGWLYWNVFIGHTWTLNEGWYEDFDGPRPKHYKIYTKNFKQLKTVIPPIRMEPLNVYNS